LDSRTKYAIRSRSFASKNGCVRSTSNSDALGAFFRYEDAVVIAADVMTRWSACVFVSKCVHQCEDFG
jgi:hypothetical protein